MAERERCGDEFWNLHCDQPSGHGLAHSAVRNGARVSWMDGREPRPGDAPIAGEGQRAARPPP
jgi:hypothetical protein